VFNCRISRMVASFSGVMATSWGYSLGGAITSSTQGSSALSQRVRSFEIHDQHMGDAVGKLRDLGVPVCFEGVRLDPTKDRFKDSSGRWVWRHVTFSLTEADASVEQILNDLIQNDPRYTYSLDQGKGILRVHPRSGSVLNWTVGHIDVENMPLGELLFGKNDVLGLIAHGVRSDMFRGSGVTERLRVPVTVRMENANVADCLTYICSVTRLPALPNVELQACYTLVPTPGRPRLGLSIVGAVHVRRGVGASAWTPRQAPAPPANAAQRGQTGN
jgi:hypothetical protein